MSSYFVKLFIWLQGAQFYREFHEEALLLLPTGAGEDWLDVGCGPGILTRMATASGYSTYGIDRSVEMIRNAKRLAANKNNSANFAVSDLDAALHGRRRYDVVSASSFLAVMPEPELAFVSLVALIKHSGRLLIIEATEKMTVLRALRETLHRRGRGRSYMLAIWGAVRSGNTLDPSIFDRDGLNVEHHLLLNGLVRATLISVSTASRHGQP